MAFYITLIGYKISFCKSMAEGKSKKNDENVCPLDCCRATNSSLTHTEKIEEIIFIYPVNFWIVIDTSSFLHYFYPFYVNIIN